MEVNSTPNTKRWGADVRMGDDDLCFGDWDYAFANEEIWAYTNGATTGGQYWVETGLKASRSQTSEWYAYRFFWADQKPSGYFEHYPSGVFPSFNTAQAVQLRYIGSDQWEVYNLGTLVGTNTGNPGPSNGAQGGLEVRYHNTDVHGRNASAYHRGGADSSDTLDWYSPHLRTEGAASGTWVDSGHRGIITSFNEGDSSCYSPAKVVAQSAGNGPSPLEDALARAKDAGNPDVSGLQTADSSRSAALRFVDGDQADSDESVTVVNIPGVYEDGAASVPADSELPTGQDMYFVYSTKGELLDLAVLPTRVDLSTLPQGQKS